MEQDLSINISSPWGEYDFKGSAFGLPFIRQCVDQLEFILAGASEDKIAGIKNDIEGYKQVLATENEELAVRFIAIKDEARKQRQRFKDNLAVIDHLKSINQWI